MDPNNFKPELVGFGIFAFAKATLLPPAANSLTQPRPHALSSVRQNGWRVSFIAPQSYFYTAIMTLTLSLVVVSFVCIRFCHTYENFRKIRTSIFSTADLIDRYISCPQNTQLHMNIHTKK